MNLIRTFNTQRILVAERDHVAMDRVSDILEAANYRVHKAYFVGDALFALEHSDIDLAIIDADMMDQTHHTLVDHVGQTLEIPWIALVEEQDEDVNQLLSQGAAAILQRPVHPETLLATIHAAMASPHPEIKSVVPNTGLLTRKGMLPSDSSPERLNLLLKERLTEQQALSTLARSLSAELDLSVLLTQIVDAAVRLCHAEEGLLLLPDDEEQALWIRAVKGIDSQTARHFRIKTTDSLAGQVFRSGRPILIGDQGLQKVKTEYLVKSLVYVPLSSKGTTIGVLGVNNKTMDRTFAEHDLDLLQDLAAHAAIAIENARLYEDSVLRTRELSTLVQASEAANSTLDSNHVLASIAEHAIHALNVSQCHICEWQPDENRLVTLAVRQEALWLPGEGPNWTLKQYPPLERAFTQHRAVIQHGIPPEPPFTSSAAWLPQAHALGCAYIPIYTPEQFIGIIALYRLHEPFSDQNAPDIAPLQQQGFEIALLLTGQDTRPHKRTLDHATQNLLDNAAADWVEMALWNADKKHFEVVLSYGTSVCRSTLKPGLDLASFPQLAHVLTEQEPLTAATSDDLLALQELGHSKSLLIVPLVIKGKTAGLVALSHTLPARAYTRRDVKLAQALVLQAANALDNARLFRDLETSLTELHRAQSKLVQTARLSAMGELAAAVAHQINNPLTTILGDTELILQDLPEQDINRESVEAISRAGKRAHEVVRRLLAMARQKHGDERGLGVIDVNTTIHNTLTLVRSHVQQGGVLLVVELQDSLPPILATMDELEDVWLNMLLNARDAVTNRPNPQIGIRTAFDPATQQIRVTICDNGIGIPQELQARIFEPFFTTKPLGEGTGLGLHICQQVISKCKGSMSVQSAYNEGAEFVICLPAFTK